MSKTKEQICEICKNVFIRKLYSNQKHCSNCRATIKCTKKLICTICNQEYDFPTNTKINDAICINCKQQGFKRQLQKKIVTCFYCKKDF